MRKIEFLEKETSSLSLVRLDEKEEIHFIGGEKGDEDDPYTFDEFNSYDPASWPGGYVEGLGNVLPTVIVDGDHASSEEEEESDSDESESEDSEMFSESESSESESSPSSSWAGGGSGNSSGNGNSNQDQPYTTGTKKVLSTKDFVGYDINDKEGCLRRCDEMLIKTNTSRAVPNAYYIMSSFTTTGRADKASISSQLGIDYINSELLNNHGIIVGVDKRDKHSYNGVGDMAADHYIIIIGRDQMHVNGQSYYRYYFFDPATAHSERGASSSNILTVQNGLLKGKFGNYNYVVTNVRKNK